MGYKKSQGKWTDEEREYLRLNWGKKGSLICGELTGHSRAAVRQKAKEFGLTRTTGARSLWKDEEIRYLKENYADTTIKDMAFSLSRTQSSIANEMKKLGLRKRVIQCKSR